MSLINKTPYLNTILKRLSASNLVALSSLVNGADQVPGFHSLLYGKRIATDAIDTVSLAAIEIAVGVVLEGYLISTTTADLKPELTLVYFSNNRQSNLGLLKIDPKTSTYSYIDETLTTLELRSEIADVMSEKGAGIKVQADDIDSSTALGAGTVLTADGDGGAYWGLPNKIYKHTITVDSNGATLQFEFKTTSASTSTDLEVVAGVMKQALYKYNLSDDAPVFDVFYVSEVPLLNIGSMYRTEDSEVIVSWTPVESITTHTVQAI